ncbi:hypothetical protein [Campylobacter corcagiensis]|uniref:Uncharacterized protein n=1 Tax=Campylobacter corcagiensis TaxID=1448857 RepID=A0A7M1LGV3_9BACT|nr:hypothetical protein [Campylobacter corcagiensis]QKF64573.1 hypothetical protein CCORG_0712 [Campylobacter corcagiensis]QOQ87254.1 hypothetical protein IMC76_08610 [Campylobacter corcagiensis]
MINQIQKIFKRKNSLSSENIIDYIFEKTKTLYFQSLKPCLYSDFLKLDKFEKIQHFTIKNLDIDVINLVYSGYFFDKIYYKCLDKEKRKLIRQLGHNSNTLSDIYHYHENLAYNIVFYIFQTANMDDDFWYFNISGYDNPNKKADKKYLTPNDPFFEIYYPPNFFGDTSSVRAISEFALKYSNKEHQKYKKLKTDTKLYVDDDFNFNIPKYFINNVFDKKEIKDVIKKVRKFNISLC